MQNIHGINERIVSTSELLEQKQGMFLVKADVLGVLYLF